MILASILIKKKKKLKKKKKKKKKPFIDNEKIYFILHLI